MKITNKIDFKRCLLVVLLVSVLLTVILTIFNAIEYRSYRHTTNIYIDNVLSNIRFDYPEVNIDELIKILNDPNLKSGNILASYGIDLNETTAILKSDLLNKKFTILRTSLIVLSFLILSSVYLYYIFSKEKKIKSITALLERINSQDYSLDISTTSEDELSILRTEVYKTTLMHRHRAQNAVEDKANLKRSLEDISHQLKTPLTSVSIATDNLIEIDDMSKEERIEALKSIRRETDKINFLIQSLLKLSKLDTNTVQFDAKMMNIKSIIAVSIENVSLIADLKDVKFDIEGPDSTILCDAAWQTEALTNIIKNAVEHSLERSTITIEIEKSKMFTTISINNRGEHIEMSDIPHIFERFYRGKNATPGSVGIGLALASSIIKAEQGRLTVESNEKDGTTFKIEYPITQESQLN